VDWKIGERQRWAWLAAGLSVAVAACACGFDWIWVLAGGLAVTGYYIYMDVRLPVKGLAVMLPRVLAAATLIWTVIAMAWTANLADRAFPMADGFPIMGWTVLALAAWGSWKGPAACARCTGVLCLFLAALYGVVVVFAVPDVQIEYLLPHGSWRDGLLAAGVFLLAGAVWYVPCTGSKKKAAWQMALLLPAFAGALAAVTAGVLSPALARSLPGPLYSLAQSVSLFGVVERIEPLLSAAMTMGVFGLLSAMTCACRALWSRFRPWKWSGVVCSAAAGLMMGWIKSTELRWIAGGAAFFWLIIPLIMVWVRKYRKKSSSIGGRS